MHKRTALCQKLNHQQNARTCGAAWGGGMQFGPSAPHDAALVMQKRHLMKKPTCHFGQQGRTRRTVIIALCNLLLSHQDQGSLATISHQSSHHTVMAIVSSDHHYAFNLLLSIGLIGSCWSNVAHAKYQLLQPCLVVHLTTHLQQQRISKAKRV